MSQRKILFTSHTANFSKFNRPFMRLLKEQGYEIHYASAGEEEVLDCDRHFTIPFSRSPLKFSNLKAFFQLRKILNKERYDIIHTHTPAGSVITRLAAKASRHKETRIIYTAHGFHFFKGAPLVNWLTYYPIEKLMARLTDILITINKEDYEHATQKFNTQVRYVPGIGIDKIKFSRKIDATAKRSLRASLGLTKNDFVLLYLAELSPRKNQLWLINVVAPLMRKNPKIHLLLAGTDSLNGACQQLVNDLGLEKNIHFLGYRNDIVELLNISDTAVSSSLQEGLPVNIMEAMYVGLPIVAINCRGTRDLVKHESTGFLVDKLDSESFRASIKRLASDSELRSQFSIRSREAIEQNYLLNAVMPKMQRLYNPEPTVIHLLNSSRFSGAEHVVCELIKNTHGYKAYYCSPSGEINDALKAHDIQHVKIDRLSYREVRKIINKYKPAIIHAHDFRASIVASLFTKHARIISHIHQNPDWLNKPGINFYLYKFRIGAFHKILVVTNVIRSTKIFQSTPAHKLITRHNTINKKAIIKKAGKTASKQYDLVFCGRLENVKQPLDFINLVAKVKQDNPNVRAVMVGGGSLYESCKALIIRLNLDKNIDLVGFQLNPYPYIRSARFLIITSEAEGFGLVALEAMLLDTIVLSYDISSIREILGGNDRVIGTNTTELAAIYQSFILSPTDIKLQIDKNRNTVGRFANSAENATDDIYGVKYV